MQIVSSFIEDDGVPTYVHVAVFVTVRVGDGPAQASGSKCDNLLQWNFVRFHSLLNSPIIGPMARRTPSAPSAGVMDPERTATSAWADTSRTSGLSWSRCWMCSFTRSHIHCTIWSRRRFANHAVASNLVRCLRICDHSTSIPVLVAALHV